MPVDYIELLGAAYPLYLISAYDIAHSSQEHKLRIHSALEKSHASGSAILMDSGNYERFWKRDGSWQPDSLHAVSGTYPHDMGFCYDNQEPPHTAEAISDDVIESVLRDQEHSSSTIVPIVHGPVEVLPAATKRVAERLCPNLLAVPERALGEGVVARVRSVRRIRQALDGLGFYCPLHLLGTGNPISILAYTMAGADSFDGLEWCQTIVDHNTAHISHFQHWDFYREQTRWGSQRFLPFVQSALMHNLDFYASFMGSLQDALPQHAFHEIIEKYLSRASAEIIRNALDGDS